MTATWHRFDPGTNILTLTLHVQPGARRTEVAGLHGDALRIRLAAPPVEDQANDQLLRYIATAFGVSAREVVLRKGQRSRRKVVEVRGASRGPDALVQPRGRQRPGMSTFWIVGIVINVGLTGLALWWVFSQMKPRDKDRKRSAPEKP